MSLQRKRHLTYYARTHYVAWWSCAMHVELSVELICQFMTVKMSKYD